VLVLIFFNFIFFIFLEFCAGGDLDKLTQHLGFREGLPESLIVVWLMQCAQALDVSTPVLIL
jgi:serine/threonine protein kinase